MLILKDNNGSDLLMLYGKTAQCGVSDPETVWRFVEEHSEMTLWFTIDVTNAEDGEAGFEMV